MAKVPCHHCGYDLKDVPQYGNVQVCPECGGYTPDILDKRPRWARRKWCIPLTVVAVSLAVSLCVGFFERAGGDPYGVLLVALFIAVIPAAAVLNGIITTGLWLVAGRSRYQPASPALRRLTAVGMGIVAAIGTAIACLGVLLFLTGDH